MSLTVEGAGEVHVTRLKSQILAGFMSGKFRTLEFAYYPGCSLEGTAREYDESLRAVCAALGVQLVELPDWNCCGGSSAHFLDRELAEKLARRNLRLAQEVGRDLLVPCAACFHRLKVTLAAQDGTLPARGERRLQELLGQLPTGGSQEGFPSAKVFGKEGNSADPLPKGEGENGEKAATGSSRSERCTIRIFHVNEFFTDPRILERLRCAIRRPLGGLQPVAYYGCLTQRPPYVMASENPENPGAMDRLLEVVGTSVRPWGYKTDCCGASLGITQPEVTRRLVATLVKAAAEAGANCIVTDCPMCQANLDMRQAEAARGSAEFRGLPVFYITELLALAIGVGRSERWWARHLVDPRPLLRSVGL